MLVYKKLYVEFSHNNFSGNVIVKICKCHLLTWHKVLLFEVKITGWNVEKEAGGVILGTGRMGFKRGFPPTWRPSILRTYRSLEVLPCFHKTHVLIITFP